MNILPQNQPSCQQTISEDELETVVAREPVLCEVSMPRGDTVQCPSINCPYTSNDRNKMRNHFAQCHIGDKIRIQEEGLLPQCNRCGFQSSVVLTPDTLLARSVRNYLCNALISALSQKTVRG